MQLGQSNFVVQLKCLPFLGKNKTNEETTKMEGDKMERFTVEGGSIRSCKINLLTVNRIQQHNKKSAWEKYTRPNGWFNKPNYCERMLLFKCFFSCEKTNKQKISFFYLNKRHLMRNDSRTKTAEKKFNDSCMAGFLIFATRSVVVVGTVNTLCWREKSLHTHTSTHRKKWIPTKFSVCMYSSVEITVNYLA